MKILEVEVDFDFFDIDCTKRYEDALKTMEKDVKELKNQEFNTVGKEKLYQMVCKFIDSVFGIGMSSKIFKGKRNLNLCIDAYEDIIQQHNEQKEKFFDRLDRYNSSRIKKDN